MHTLSSVESAQCENNQRFVPSIGIIDIVLSQICFSIYGPKKYISKPKLIVFSLTFKLINFLVRTNEDPKMYRNNSNFTFVLPMKI